MTIPKLYELFLEAGKVSTDTRAIDKGAIYFALKGDNFDGNKFADLAIEKGARAAVIDDPHYTNDLTILVDDVLTTLQQLSSYHRDQLTIPVIGLTGSNGKTTSKELIASVLATRFNVAYTKGNLNNHIGVPLTLLSISKEHEIAVVEMGANHQKEIEFLCSLCKPDYGYITNFGKAHLEGFGGIEGVIKGKTELYSFLRNQGKTAFINIEDSKQLEHSKGIRLITFGNKANADIMIKPVDHSSEYLSVEYNGLIINCQLTGTYNYSNISAAIAIGQHFGINPESIKAGIEGYQPSNNRSQISHTKSNKLILDTYNANPSSMEAALKNLSAQQADHKWVILGDMFELGDYSSEEHTKITELALALKFEKVLLVGKEFSQVADEKTQCFKTTQELTEWLHSNPVEGKTILLKGSRGMAIEKAIPFL